LGRSGFRMPQKRVVVAMSGGVDSSVAAVLLKDEGYQLTGVTMLIWPSGKEADDTNLEPEVVRAARQVAAKLDIAHQVIDLRAVFARRIMDKFCLEYGQGRTPNPCVWCNRFIKFGALLEAVRGIGADFLATGHYARVKLAQDGYKLLKGVDPAKDQSYFLYTLGQQELRHALFPVGNLSKDEVRKIAAERGLPSADRRESHDICFIPDGDYRSFINGRVAVSPGDIVDAAGNVLGRHRGLAYYTIGQRQGLGIAAARRLYVIGLDNDSNRLLVGDESQLYKSAINVSSLHWICGTVPREPVEVKAKIRYRAPEADALLHVGEGLAELKFLTPQRAVAVGQSVVFYSGEVVLGGGIIEGAMPKGGSID